MKISIIIIAYNEEKYITGILNSLANQTKNDFEVIVVDSNSIDQTRRMACNCKTEFTEFEYIKLDAARGPAFGRNRGVEASKYERLLFLDADTRVDPHFIDQITREIEDRNLDLATCPVRILEGGFLSSTGAVILNTFMILLKPFYSSAYGGCLISTKEVHRKVGGFDEKIGVCEDCNYVKKASRVYHLKFGILSPFFYTSDRRAKSEGGLSFLFKYLKIHLYRMFTGKEILKNSIEYKYGEF